MDTAVRLDSLIETSPDVRDGRPCIAGTGVTVRRIVQWYRLGASTEEIADRVGHLSLAHVYAALAYYHANREAIDTDLKEEGAREKVLANEHAD